MGSSRRNDGQAINRDIAAWRKRFNAVVQEVRSGKLSDAQMRKRADKLERERDALMVAIGKPTTEQMQLLQVPAPSDPGRRSLLKLQYEIDEDLAAGRLTQEEYDDCKQRIEDSLRALDEPLPPGERIRVVAIPRKKIDVEALAQVYYQQGMRINRARKGLPPLTEDEERYMQVMAVQARAEGKRRRAETESRDQAAEQRKQEIAHRRLRDKKPARLRQDTWDWLIDRGLREPPADQSYGAIIYSFGGLSEPKLLQSTIIQLEDGTDYVIDRQTAQDLAKATDPVTLVRLADRQRVSLPHAAVLWGITEGPLFDQLDL